MPLHRPLRIRWHTPLLRARVESRPALVRYRQQPRSAISSQFPWAVNKSYSRYRHHGPITLLQTSQFLHSAYSATLVDVHLKPPARHLSLPHSVIILISKVTHPTSDRSV